MPAYRTLFLSDLHLGMRGCQSERLLDFVRTHDAERWLLVGDVVDGWALMRNWRWPAEHTAVLMALLDKVRAGAEVVYVPGNHDGAVRPFAGLAFGGVRVERDLVHTTADGRRLLVLHGDEFDGALRYAPWVSRLGAQLYELALWANTWVSARRARKGKGYWSLAGALKARTKAVVQYVGRFEDAVAARAVDEGVDGVVCGHIHHAELRDVSPTLVYANCGDWVESCTALAEHPDGHLELVRWTDGSEPDRPEARRHPTSRPAHTRRAHARLPLAVEAHMGDGAASAPPSLPSLS